MRKLEIYDEIYEREHWLVVNCSRDRVAKMVKERTGVDIELPDHCDGASIFLMHETNEVTCVIWMEKYKDTAYWNAVLAHELFHTTHQVLETLNLPLKEASGEAYAFYFGYLFRKCYGFLNPKKK